MFPLTFSTHPFQPSVSKSNPSMPYGLFPQSQDALSLRFSGDLLEPALTDLPNGLSERLIAESITQPYSPDIPTAIDFLRKQKNAKWPEINYSPLSVENNTRDVKQQFNNGVMKAFIVLKTKHATETENQGEIIGLGILQENNSHAYIGSIYLKESYRGQKLGKWYLDHLGTHAQKLGYSELYLEVRSDNPAIHLYQREAFEEISRKPDPKNDHVELIKMKKMDFPTGQKGL